MSSSSSEANRYATPAGRTTPAPPAGQPRALYVHVPFCPSVCPYCDFHKMLRSGPLVARYLDRLEAEIEAVSAAYTGPLDTVYFGGGTPSHLTDAELERVFGALQRAWGGTGYAAAPLARTELTLEADPLTFDTARLERFAALGVTRLSIGLQSTQDAVLSFLGRVHDSAAGLEAVRLALTSGLQTNVDIIMAVPGQQLANDLRTVLDMGASHLSVYSLTIEPNTPFGRRGVRVDPEADADAFELAGEVIAEYGLRRYEVSNFALPGRESHHNLAYWRGQHYLAVGPGASAYLPEGPFGTRLKNPPIKTWLLGAEPEREVLTADDVVLERLMTGLRTAEGVDLTALAERTGAHVTDLAPAWLKDATRHGLLTRAEGDVLRATEVGLERLDALLRTFANSRALIG
ncbi:MAG: radical SAM family heme chaperone HemW [Trueperaceae bacterium]